MTGEDVAVCGKVLAALGELGIALLIQEPVPIMWDYGPHRLYQFQVLVRDDEPFDTDYFKKLMTAFNVVGRVKPLIYSVEEYSAENSNFTYMYVTMCI